MVTVYLILLLQIIQELKLLSQTIQANTTPLGCLKKFANIKLTMYIQYMYCIESYANNACISSFHQTQFFKIKINLKLSKINHATK